MASAHTPPGVFRPAAARPAPPGGEAKAMSLLDFRRSTPPTGRRPRRSPQAKAGLSQRTAVLGNARGAVGEAPAFHVDLDLAALEVAANEFFGERILDVTLNGAAQRPGAIRAVLARLIDDPVDHVGRK